MKPKAVANPREVHLALSVSGEAEVHRFPVEDIMIEQVNAFVKHGGLYNQSMAAALTGVSKQRISQLVRAGRLRIVKLDIVTPTGVIPGEETIPGDDLARWAKEPKLRGGRGKKAVPVQLEAMAA